MRAAAWMSWVLGVAMLAAVIVAALHFSEQRQMVDIAQRAQPWWLAVALALQAATYAAQGETWRLVMRAGGVRLPAMLGFEFSLAKLFVDQALPSAGLSGTLLVAGAFERRGVPRPVVMAAMIVGTVAYYGAYVGALLVALAVTAAGARLTPVMVAVAGLLAAFSGVLITAVLALSGRRSAGPAWLRRLPLAGRLLALPAEADPRLARSAALIGRGVLCQLAIVLLDVATLWVLIRALGESAAPAGVFASFMASSLLRTVSVVPGGLGVFEAASVVTLQQAGVSLPAALAATLLFRGYSFWLPMLPGVFFARAAGRLDGAPAHAGRDAGAQDRGRGR
ncbi:lysylphosphatidylglycerol synthase transmembrane domain-containing protein [Duganella hordei]|uniref:lysylphosphatidylglycerol synthase transmembrane domain-containing protein n=1 Tax=Duganella hordei TaxID=2865934 RepID=UPI0030EAC888